jgi:signal transduction histidine kinase
VRREARVRSLRVRLPLLISALIAVSLVTFLSISFVQVQRALLLAGEARAQAASDQLASLLAQLGQRLPELRRLAQDGDVTKYLQQPDAGGEEAARQRLAPLTATGQPAVELWDDAGHRLLAVPPAKATPAPPASPPSQQPAAEGVGTFQASGQFIYWDVVAEVHGGTRRGFLVSRRFLSQNGAGSDALSRLVGAGAVIRLGNASGGVWSDLSRLVASPPAGLQQGSVRDDRAAAVGWASKVRGTPWMVLVEFPRSAIVAPAMAYLTRMLVVIAILVLAAAIAAYVLSARITTPLGQLTHAAEAIAHGRFEKPIPSGRPDEIGRLATAFQTMALEVQTTRRELETRVEARVGELKNLTAELEAFSYSVSHDLRAPVRHIAGFAALLEKSAEASIDQTGRRYLKIISDSAARMGRLIDDLLAFSRMNRTEMLLGRVDLSSLVEDVRQELHADRAGASSAWIVHPLPVVEGDAAMLRIVLMNLLSNAVKYSAPRSPATIEIGCERGPGEIVLFVRDNGVGFDMAHAKNLFGVFQRLHSSDQFEGIGIGLANVRRIVTRHGGRTWAESAPDQGATFFVALPTGEPGVRSVIGATTGSGLRLAPTQGQAQT